MQLKPHVFSASTTVDPEILRTLRVLHEEQARLTLQSVTALLGGVELVRSELMGIEQRIYGEVPTSENWLRVNVHAESLSSTVVWILSVPFIRAFAQVLQGGDGHPPQGELTEVDLGLARRLLERLVDSWSRAWAPLLKVNALVPDRISTGVVFGDIGIEPHTTILEIRYRLQGADWPEPGMDEFSLCLPLGIMENRAKVFRRENQRAGRRHPEEDGWHPEVWPFIPVEMTFRLRSKPVPLQYLLTLRAGDNIPLAGSPTESEIWAGGRLIAWAEEIAQDERGIRVAKKIVPARGVEMADEPQHGIGVDKVMLEVTGVLGSAKRSVEDLKKLEPDAVILLNTRANDPILVAVEGVPVGEAEVYTTDEGLFALRITRVLSASEVTERSQKAGVGA